jgi:outer membrane immunogenic protein
MKKFLLAGIGAAALTAAGSAGAADFPVYKAPPPAVASLSWSGCYGGVNGGGGWARSEFTSGSGDTNQTTNGFFTPGVTLGDNPGSKVSNDLSGGVFGGHLGCQFQWGSWVFGVEAGADGADIKGSTTATARFLPSPNVQQNSFDTRVKWLATATPRLGFASGPWMYYVKGGFAAAQVDISLSRLTGDNAGISFSDRESRVGWTAGTGLEWMFARGWILGVEYNYIDLGSDFYGGHAAFPSGLIPGRAFMEDHKLTINQVLGRLSYKFSWGEGPGSY